MVLNTPDFIWTDIVEPTAAELDDIARQHKLHPVAVADCLEPAHLPKSERFGAVTFLILRAFDDQHDPAADTVQEITRKLAAFLDTKFLVTVHRVDQKYIQDVRQKWSLANAQEYPAPERLASAIAVDLMRGAIASYEVPISQARDKLDHLEENVFKPADEAHFDFRQGYFTRRQALAYKQVLKLTLDALGELSWSDGERTHYARDLKDLGDRLLFYATDLAENATTILNLALSVASQRTNLSTHRANEIMKVLTVFSVFFLPLNFMAGVYGMNFEKMPFLTHPQGFWIVLFLMFLISLLIFRAFNRRGWLHRESELDPPP